MHVNPGFEMGESSSEGSQDMCQSALSFPDTVKLRTEVSGNGWKLIERNKFVFRGVLTLVGLCNFFSCPKSTENYVVSNIYYIVFHIFWILYPIGMLMLFWWIQHMEMDNLWQVLRDSVLEHPLAGISLLVVIGLQSFKVTKITVYLPKVITTFQQIGYIMEKGYLSLLRRNKTIVSTIGHDAYLLTIVISITVAFGAVGVWIWTFSTTYDSEVVRLNIFRMGMSLAFMILPVFSSLLISTIIRSLSILYKKLTLEVKELSCICIESISEDIKILQDIHRHLMTGFGNYVLSYNAFATIVNTILCTDCLLSGAEMLVYVLPLLLGLIPLLCLCSETNNLNDKYMALMLAVDQSPNSETLDSVKKGAKRVGASLARHPPNIFVLGGVPLGMSFFVLGFLAGVSFSIILNI